MSRRLNFLHYILHEDENSLIYLFLMAQSDNPGKNDWVHTVNEDLQRLDIQLNFEGIKQTSKSSFKQLVKERVRTKAFHYLTQLQQTHSKSKDLKYSEFKLQDYLKPDNNMTIKEKAFLFSARSRMVEVNCNFKSGKSDLMCRKCKIEEEDQRHLLVCPKLSEMALCCKTIDYEDLHGSDTSKLEIIGKVLMEKLHLLLSDNVNIITPLCTNNLLCAASTQEELE